MTKKEVSEKLTAAGIDFPARATLSELLELWADSQPEPAPAAQLLSDPVQLEPEPYPSPMPAHLAGRYL